MTFLAGLVMWFIYFGFVRWLLHRWGTFDPLVWEIGALALFPYFGGRLTAFMDQKET